MLVFINLYVHLTHVNQSLNSFPCTSMFQCFNYQILQSYHSTGGNISSLKSLSVGLELAQALSLLLENSTNEKMSSPTNLQFLNIWHEKLTLIYARACIVSRAVGSHFSRASIERCSSTFTRKFIENSVLHRNNLTAIHLVQTKESVLVVKIILSSRDS